MNNTAIKVLRLGDVDRTELSELLSQYQLHLNLIGSDEAIPGSFWGDEEAGLIGNTIYARTDTPIHSILHESCHYICMSEHRRSMLHTDAGGTNQEENAVCYLQILLSEQLSFTSKQSMTQDMDNWGYSFRLGSAVDWFENDAEDAYNWLLQHDLITQDREITLRLRY